MKKVLLLMLVACALAGCSSTMHSDEISEIGFSQSLNLDKIRALNNRQVSIVGYMATLSPLSGKYMYLMNMPYQTCPFCVPNTTQLANTLAVYAPDGKTFDYTDQAIRVTGRIEMGDSTDEFGYSYNYRIVDARYEVVDLSTVSGEYALWHSIAEDGVVPQINAMFDYLYFVCQWPDYQQTIDTENGPTAIYLDPIDVETIFEDTGVNGYASYRAEDYFPRLIARVEGISKTGLSDLVEIIKDAKTLEQDALKEFTSGEYAYDQNEMKYNLINNDALASRFDEIYLRFAEWIAKWEV